MNRKKPSVRTSMICHSANTKILRVSVPAILFTLILGLSACKSQKKAGKQESTSQASETSGRSQGIMNARELSESGNLFAVDLFKQLQADKPNIVFSPYSISSVMGMVYSGAAGGTAEEMAEVLYLPPRGGTEQAASELDHKILSADTLKGIEVNLANAIWAQQNFKFLESFTEKLETWYRAPLTMMDFEGMEAREQSRQQINGWVEEETRGRIRDLIAPGVLSANTRMVLTNAIYFKGRWQWPFSKEMTLHSMFHVSKEESLRCDFMSQTRAFDYYEDEEVQAVRLPYAGGRWSMLIVLPRETEGWEMISRVIDEKRLKNLEGNLSQREVYLSIPKFTFEMKMNLKDELAEMGMPLAFSRDADFSGMTGEKNLYIDEVIHKAFVEVNETGTEAAAATGAIMSLKSALRDEPVRFNADHPFLYLIRDQESGSILFMGRLVKPEAN